MNIESSAFLRIRLPALAQYFVTNQSSQKSSQSNVGKWSPGLLLQFCNVNGFIRINEVRLSGSHLSIHAAVIIMKSFDLL